MRGKRRPVCATPGLLADEVEQVGGVAGVEHAEAGRQAERGGVAAHERWATEWKVPPTTRPACRPCGERPR